MEDVIQKWKAQPYPDKPEKARESIAIRDSEGLIVSENLYTAAFRLVGIPPPRSVARAIREMGHHFGWIFEGEIRSAGRGHFLSRQQELYRNRDGEHHGAITAELTRLIVEERDERVRAIGIAHEWPLW